MYRGRFGGRFFLIRFNLSLLSLTTSNIKNRLRSLNSHVLRPFLNVCGLLKFKEFGFAPRYQNGKKP
jgi:hypothetical protein